MKRLNNVTVNSEWIHKQNPKRNRFNRIVKNIVKNIIHLEIPNQPPFGDKNYNILEEYMTLDNFYLFILNHDLILKDVNDSKVVGN